MFVKHRIVEVYLLEVKMCQKQFQSGIINISMSRCDVIGENAHCIIENGVFCST